MIDSALNLRSVLEGGYMFRKPVFWGVFILISVLCVAWAVMNFGTAFPIVNLDVQMDRQGALAGAEELADVRGWGPEDARQATAFRLDSEVHSFVELEAGGKEAYAEMLQGELYSPYTWVVRRFREGETNESTIRFRPDGTPYGFRETLSEDEHGASLDPEWARAIAEAVVAKEWNIDLGAFELVESAQEVMPGGRTDHDFVYQRPDVTIGDGRYRLRLVVSGDELTELTHFVKVPEAFSRRYEEMRSANNGIAAGAGFAVVIFYLVGGCAVGLFFLLRDRWVVWKPALKWGLFVAFLQFLVVLNQWPLLWMGYDTAVSSTTFALQQVAIALAQLVGMGAVLTLSFMAAESLGRRAFPHHLQLWKVWTGQVAASRAVLGQTIAGFLLIGVFFAYDVWLYAVAGRYLGWWSPSDALIDPNVLANIFPWLTSVAVSLQAGFWEECLFRAVPLAGAALLGKKFGKPWLWITGAMILQAVIFGGGHANYPAQPAYVRLVELIIPALGFGGLYLVFGLMPAIVLHFAFDVVWFALPLFSANSPGLWIDRSIVIILTLIPVWVLLRARWRAGAWGDVPEADFNGGWQPPPAPAEAPPVELVASAGLGGRLRTGLLVAGVIGIVLWAIVGGWRTEAPPLQSGDSAARKRAQESVASRGFVPEAPWRELSNVDTPRGTADRFVWQEGGEEAYRDLFNRYLLTPRRMVRYARFEGDVADRAEEYRIYVGPDGAVQRVIHQLPEGRSGAELEEDAARALALATVNDEFALAPPAIEEVSAEPSQLEARRDWTFVYKDTANFPLESGEARIMVQIAGDEVAETGRFVHVPEEWERTDRSRSSTSRLVSIVCNVLVIVLFLAGAVVAIVRWSHHRFATAVFVVVFGLLAVIGATELANGFRAITANFMTAQPFLLQVVITVVGGLIGVLAIAAVSALLAGLSHGWLPAQPKTCWVTKVAAFGLGALLAGIGAVASKLGPSLSASWPDFDGAAASFPLVAAALGPISSWVTGTVLVLTAVAVLHAASSGWQKRTGLLSALIVVLGLVLAGAGAVETIPLWLVEGLLTGLVLLAVWVLAVRHHPAIVPLVTAAGAVLTAIERVIVGAYPGAAIGSVIAAVLIVLLAVVWTDRLSKEVAPDGV